MNKHGVHMHIEARTPGVFYGMNSFAVLFRYGRKMMDIPKALSCRMKDIKRQEQL